MAAVKLVSRYIIVGLTVAATYWLLTYAASALTDIPIVIISTICFTIAIILQYFLHAYFTYSHRSNTKGQSIRFGVSVALGYIISIIITGWLGPTFELPTYITVTLVVVLIPITNFIFFSLWVFKP